MEQSIDSEKIKRLRRKHSWSQEKLATVSGLSLRTVQRIENEGVCSLESRQALAATLQVDPSTLECGQDTQTFIGQELSTTRFENSNLGKATFINSNMVETRFEDINFSKADFNDINLRQATFSQTNFSNTVFNDVNLREVVITDANISQMSVNGYLLTELIEHYEKTRK